MNFQNIAPVSKSEDYLDLAFRKARERSRKKIKGPRLKEIKEKEKLKLKIVKEELTSKLSKIITSFPRLESLPKFYQELIKITCGYQALKKALGGVDWVIKKIRFFYETFCRKINKSNQEKKIIAYRKEFYGRVSSLMKQIKESLFFLEDCRRIMKDYPDIKEMFTVVIFGFPNVGKTTLLNKFTGAKGKIATYAFTTKGINSGFIELKGKKIQILDVPGTLARKEKRNNIEKIAYLVVKELADLVLYVFDLKEASYPLKKQEILFRLLKKEFKKEILIYLSKKDLLTEEEIKKFKERYKEEEFLENSKELFLKIK